MHNFAPNYYTNKQTQHKETTKEIHSHKRGEMDPQRQLREAWLQKK